MRASDAFGLLELTKANAMINFINVIHLLCIWQLTVLLFILVPVLQQWQAYRTNICKWAGMANIVACNGVLLNIY